jgi:hypothetical protein
MILISDTIIVGRELLPGASFYPGPRVIDSKVKLQARDLLRWRLASLAIQKYSRAIPDSNDHKLLTKEPYNNPANVKLLEWPLLLCLPIPVAIYGAVIAAAWNYQFTGYSDQNLWRASSIVFLAPTVYPFIYFPGYLLF